MNLFNRSTLVVGGGNVAFDILSVLTLSKHLFAPDTINQQFLDARDEFGSTHVVAIIRKQPWELASDIHVLREFFSLMKQSNVIVEGSGISAPTRELSDDEKEKLELCLEYIGNAPPTDVW